MSSILTNNSAIAALSTLRSIDHSMSATQNRVSSGLRISSANENAAYWSISTTMRSDNMAISAVVDALGIGAASVDVAYAGMESVSDLLATFKAKLVAAKEEGVDKSKIQEELSQLQAQVVSVAQSASFNGVNWLTTNINDLHDATLNKTYVSSAFIRDTAGVSVSRTNIDLSKMSLFNSSGSGLLQSDSRQIINIGGIKTHETTINNDGTVDFFPDNLVQGSAGRSYFFFEGPITFGAADTYSFDITVDEDNPLDLPPPHNPGLTTNVVIDRNMVDQILPGSGGVISTTSDYVTLLNHALSANGSGAVAGRTTVWNGSSSYNHPTHVYIGSAENSGLDGSSIKISNFTSTTSTGGLSNSAATHFGSRASLGNSLFLPYEVGNDADNPNGVTVTFDFTFDGVTKGPYSFDRAYVNNVLGITDGKVATAADQVTLLTSLLAADWPDLKIETNAYGDIVLTPDETMNRLSGARTSFGFTNINVSNEPVNEQNFTEIDIVAFPQRLDRYIDYVEKISADVITAAATLGSLKSRIAMQEDFANLLMDTINKGIGRLVDADMNEESTRLKALQTQQQLGIQALSIANANAENIITLFR